MDDQELIKIIENTNAMLNREGFDADFFSKIGARVIDIPGVKGYIIPIDSENLNHVGLAMLTEDNVDSTVQKVIDFFKKERKSFSWIIGPGSEPSDLSDHLLKHGFYPLEDFTEYGMAISTDTKIENVTDKFSIEEIPIGELEQNVDLISESFGMGMNRDAAMSIVMLMNAINSTERYRGQISAYVAVEKDSGKKVGFSGMTMDREAGYAILDGSGVLPSYRRNGVYRAMVSKRLQVAREKGIEYLIIHAMKNTSAPICEKLGFRKICKLDFYGYRVQQ